MIVWDIYGKEAMLSSSVVNRDLMSYVIPSARILKRMWAQFRLHLWDLSVLGPYCLSVCLN